MKKLMVVLAALGSLSAFAAPKASSPQDVVSSLEDAFNKRDANTASQLFASDATLITPDGQRAHGQPAIQKLLGQQLGTYFNKDTKNQMKIDGQRPIGANAVWVDVTQSVSNVLKSNGQRGDVQWHGVLLLEKHGGQWRAEEVRPYAFVPKAPLGTGGSGK